MTMAKREDRFQLIQQEGNGLTGPQIQVLLDTVTGVQYLLTQYGSGVGLCPLLDRDGKPLAWNM